MQLRRSITVVAASSDASVPVRSRTCIPPSFESAFMPVRCECIDVIVPIANIDRVYPGGFSAFKAEYRDNFGVRFWHDDHLFRDGAMSPRDAGTAVEFWEPFGLIATTERDGGTVFADLCVVESLLGGPTLPCDWIVFDGARRCLYLAGTPDVPVVGREEMGTAPE